METAELAETARKALDILDRDGWNKGALTMYPELKWGHGKSRHRHPPVAVG